MTLDELSMELAERGIMLLADVGSDGHPNFERSRYWIIPEVDCREYNVPEFAAYSRLLREIDCHQGDNRYREPNVPCAFASASIMTTNLARSS